MDDDSDYTDIIQQTSTYMTSDWHGHERMTALQPADRETLAASPLYVDPLVLELPTSFDRSDVDIPASIEHVRDRIGQHLGIVPPDVHVDDVEGERWRLLLHLDEIAGGSSKDASVTDVMDEVGRSIELHAGELLTFDATTSLLTWARRESPALVASLVPAVYDVSTIRGVLKQLLRDGVPIRPISVVLGAMSDVGRQTGASDLAEAIRPQLWRLVRRRIAQPDGAIRVVRVAPGAVHGIRSSVHNTGRGHVLRLADDLARQLQLSVEEARAAHEQLAPFVLACPSRDRRWVSSFVTRTCPGALVVGDEELALMPSFEEVATVGAGIVPVPQVSGDGRNVVEAFVDNGSYGSDWNVSGGYLIDC